MDISSPRKPKNNSRLAIRALSNAAIERRAAKHAGKGASVHLEAAKRLESVASELMKPAGPPTVRSGEVAFVSGETGPRREISNTLSDPDQTAIEASVARTELLMNSGTDISALALDAATSVDANNSLEKMLAHQVAALHTLMMKTTGRALEMEENLITCGGEVRQINSVEFSRMAQAAARLSAAFQDALITMQRWRNGGSQTITIRQVSVETGGQAVIGNVTSGGHRAAGSGRGNSK